MYAKRQSELGQSYVEFIIVAPVLIVIIAVITGFGQLLYAKLAVQGAAWSAARHAVATLDENRGVQQANLATRYALAGFGLDPNDATNSITVWGQWHRSTQIRVRVCIRVPPPPVPLGDLFTSHQACASQTMPVYKWKSEWQ